MGWRRAFNGDRLNPLRFRQHLRKMNREITVEGVQGGESLIARADPVVAHGFDHVKEVENTFCGQVGKRQARNRSVADTRHIRQEEFQRIPRLSRWGPSSLFRSKSPEESGLGAQAIHLNDNLSTAPVADSQPSCPGNRIYLSTCTLVDKFRFARGQDRIQAWTSSASGFALR